MYNIIISIVAHFLRSNTRLCLDFDDKKLAKDYEDKFSYNDYMPKKTVYITCLDLMVSATPAIMQATNEICNKNPQKIHHIIKNVIYMISKFRIYK